MPDLESATLIRLKGWLFLLGGLVAGGLLLLEHADPRTAFLLVVCVWCFCRFYYFAFYVIEHYVDGEYRFAGLASFVRYLFSSRPGTSHEEDDGVTNQSGPPD